VLDAHRALEARRTRSRAPPSWRASRAARCRSTGGPQAGFGPGLHPAAAVTGATPRWVLADPSRRECAPVDGAVGQAPARGAGGSWALAAPRRGQLGEPAPSRCALPMELEHVTARPPTSLPPRSGSLGHDTGSVQRDSHSAWRNCTVPASVPAGRDGRFRRSKHDENPAGFGDSDHARPRLRWWHVMSEAGTLEAGPPDRGRYGPISVRVMVVTGNPNRRSALEGTSARSHRETASRQLATMISSKLLFLEECADRLDDSGPPGPPPTSTPKAAMSATSAPAVGGRARRLPRPRPVRHSQRRSHRQHPAGQPHGEIVRRPGVRDEHVEVARSARSVADFISKPRALQGLVGRQGTCASRSPLCYASTIEQLTNTRWSARRTTALGSDRRPPTSGWLAGEGTDSRSATVRGGEVRRGPAGDLVENPHTAVRGGRLPDPASH